MSLNDKPDAYERFAARYEEERIPWDDPAPPPEIAELAQVLPPGRALDLGCGYGRASVFLAQHGWRVNGIDFIPKAIAVAWERAAAAGVADRIDFHVASAAKLDFLTPPYDLAIDVGCMHSFSEELLRAYSDELARLLRPGGLYVLFAHLRDATHDVAEDGPRGIPENLILDLLDDQFSLERVEHGITQVEDRPPWHSGWFWFRRK
jgi:SAM-dependent methyltransferase